MSTERSKKVYAALQAIPVESRPLVAEWLYETARNADDCAHRLRQASPEPIPVSVAGTICHYRSLAGTCRMLASRVDTAAHPASKKARGKGHGSKGH